jgi:hypothetical protein
MAYDSESKQVILFGGNTGDPVTKDNQKTDTWAFDPVTKQWEQMSLSTHPEGFVGDMTYNSKADLVILVINTNPLTPDFFDYQITQTWAYDFNTNTWTQLADGPSGRLGAKIAYDSESDVTILFGGYSLITDQFFNETWAYDFNTDTWTLRHPSTTPKDQNYQAMAYDSKADRVVNWGGETEKGLWTYDYNTDTWEELKLENEPGAIYYCGFTYNENAGLFILFGGTRMGSNETWTYELNSNTWKQLQPVQNPGELSHLTLVYDPITDQAIFFGGQIGPTQWSYSGETWSLDLKKNTWTNIVSE